MPRSYFADGSSEERRDVSDEKVVESEGWVVSMAVLREKRALIALKC
jgi:hypothetical protein